MLLSVEPTEKHKKAALVADEVILAAIERRRGDFFSDDLSDDVVFGGLDTEIASDSKRAFECYVGCAILYAFPHISRGSRDLDESLLKSMAGALLTHIHQKVGWASFEALGLDEAPRGVVITHIMNYLRESDLTMEQAAEVGMNLPTTLTDAIIAVKEVRSGEESNLTVLDVYEERLECCLIVCTDMIFCMMGRMAEDGTSAVLNGVDMTADGVLSVFLDALENVTKVLVTVASAKANKEVSVTGSLSSDIRTDLAELTGNA